MAAFLTGAVLFCMISCSPFAPEIRKSPAGALPAVYSLYQPGTERPGMWWKEFNAPELNALIAEAFSESFTLREAWARLNRAKALARQAGASLYPEVTGTSEASGSRQRFNNDFGGRTTISQETYSLGLAGSYELDLWGKIRSEQEAAILDTTATREDLNAAAMTLAAEVSERWIGIIAARMEREILKEQLKINLIYLELVELRFRKGKASALEVYQQRQIVEKVKSEIPLVELEEQLLQHSLALLMGKLPQAPLAIAQSSLPEITAVPETGLPADLLSARPDVRAAGFRLKAADWQVSAARANRLPNIYLSASTRYLSGGIDGLFNNWLYALAANLTAPLFDGNRRKSEVDRTMAVVDENLSAYRRTVYTAVKEVEDALVSEEKKRRHIVALEEEIRTARKALTEARERYIKGLNDYLPVLTQLLRVQELEVLLLNRRVELLFNRVALYRALGGTWTQTLAPEKAVKTEKTEGMNTPEG